MNTKLFQAAVFFYLKKLIEGRRLFQNFLNFTEYLKILKIYEQIFPIKLY